jgi:hypothetical protein
MTDGAIALPANQAGTSCHLPIEAPEPEPLYRLDELKALRREILLYARSFPPGSERNQHRQIAMSLRRLFKNKKWLDANTLDG